MANNILFLAPSERTGSTWILDVLNSHPDIIAKTEPLRQQIPRENPIHPLTTSDVKLMGNVDYSSYWWRELLRWVDSSGNVTIIKETNLFFRCGWLVKELKDRCNIFILDRDIRGILSSFKRGSLFARWNYQHVYEIIKKTINKDENLSEEYSKLIDSLGVFDSVKIIALLYVLNMNEIIKSTQNLRPLYIRYEQVRENPESMITRILKLAKLDMTDEIRESIENSMQTRRSGSQEDHDYATTRRPDTDDWRSILNQEDLATLQLVIQCSLNTLPLLSTANTEGKYCPFGHQIPSNALSIFRNKSSEFTVSSREFIFRRRVLIEETERDELITSVQQTLVLASLSQNKSIWVSNILVSNIQFAGFLNWLLQHGIENIVNGQYLFINTGMAPDRGGRIFREAASGRYGVIEGYQNHPANWIYFTGANLFCYWIGGRLLTSHEYDELEASYLQDGAWKATQNADNKCGDTRSVWDDDAKLKDLKGNVSVWTSTGDTELGCNTRVAKGGAFNSPMRPLGYSELKPTIFCGRDLGIRPGSDRKELSPPNEEVFVRKINELTEIRNLKSYSEE